MIQLLAAFFIISLSGALSPGPLTTMAIVEGSRRGKWSGWWLSVGHGVAEVTLVAAIALLLWLGREAVLEQPIVAGLIALIGGVFLGWMGWSMATAAWGYKLTLSGGDSFHNMKIGLVPAGVFLSISNPYWWIWWVLLVSFYIRDSLVWGVWGVLALFVVHWLTDVGWLTGLSWLTGSGRSIMKPGLYRWIIIGCGVILLFFGISFVIAGIGFLMTGRVGTG